MLLFFGRGLLCVELANATLNLFLFLVAFCDAHVHFIVCVCACVCVPACVLVFVLAHPSVCLRPFLSAVLFPVVVVHGFRRCCFGGSRTCDCRGKTLSPRAS